MFNNRIHSSGRGKRFRFTMYNCYCNITIHDTNGKFNNPLFWPKNLKNNKLSMNIKLLLFFNAINIKLNEKGIFFLYIHVCNS